MKYDLGWIDDNEVAWIKESGTYQIHAIRELGKDATGKPLCAAFQMTEGTFFISYEPDPIPSDHGGLAPKNLKPGLLVHVRPQGSPGICRLLDFTPQSSDAKKKDRLIRPALAEVDEFRDAAIPKGKTMTINGKVKIQLLETGQTNGVPWASVKVEL